MMKFLAEKVTRKILLKILPSSDEIFSRKCQQENSATNSAKFCGSRTQQLMQNNLRHNNLWQNNLWTEQLTDITTYGQNNIWTKQLMDITTYGQNNLSQKQLTPKQHMHKNIRVNTDAKIGINFWKQNMQLGILFRFTIHRNILITTCR